MHPILFESTSFPLPAWHVFFMLSAFYALYIAQFLLKQNYPEVSTNIFTKLSVLCYVTGYLGARGWSIITEYPHLTLQTFFYEITQLGSMSLFGGIGIGLLMGTVYIILTDSKNILKYFDVSSFAVVSSIAIGRIGCFLNGDDYGIPTSQTTPPFYAVVFPNHSDPVYRIPIQLFESLALVIFCSLLYFVFSQKQKMQVGKLGVFALGGYATIRFFDEFFRGDDRGALLFQLITIPQACSIALIIISIGFFQIQQALITRRN